MPKQLLLLLAGLSLLFAAMALGRQPGAAPTRARSTVHARAAVHATSHDRTAIEDDDDADDDDVADTAVLAPQQQENNLAPDDVTDERASVVRTAIAITESAAPSTGRSIRPSGEHRSTTDRPPRS